MLRIFLKGSEKVLEGSTKVLLGSQRFFLELKRSFKIRQGWNRFGL